MVCGCGGSADVKGARERSLDIDKQLRADKKKRQHEVKLLLLGAGEAGKSTILKQMKVIHSDGFTPDDLLRMKPSVFVHIVSSCVAILDAMTSLYIPFAEAEETMKPLGEMILKYGPSPRISALPPEAMEAVMRLWRDAGFRECYERGNEYQLNDNTAYFLDNAARIAEPDYLPTQEDVIRLRVQTTGIFETKFVTSGVTFNMFDVGGQRSERRKWLQCFGDVTGIIFICAVSSYDQCLREDQKTNRLMEALALFETIWKNQYLANVSVILFQNKIDIFETKIVRSDLSRYFPEYTGGPDYEEGLRFIQNKFLEIAGELTGTRKVYPHFICAVDTDIVRRVFVSVRDVVLNANLRRYQFL